MQHTYVVHTDGSCLQNPGRGGWAAVIRLGSDMHEISGGARLSTNNRMELRAAIEALRAIPAVKQSKVHVYSDSQLVVNGIEKGWARKWKANNWKRNKSDKAENPDLWDQLLNEIDIRTVRFEWTKAHVGNPDNERCDVLAKAAAEKSSEIDAVYENSRGNHIAGSGAKGGRFSDDGTRSLGGTQSVPEPERLFNQSDADQFEVVYRKQRSSIVIRHPKLGHVEIPTADIAPLLERMKRALEAHHE